MIKKEIGMNAGRIWKYLRGENKEIAVSALKQALGLNDEDCGLSIGWLAREDKIFIAFKGNNMFLICQ
ncbi:MAG: winged helix-turn-helix domain-containing protein [Paludibacteraceae bacterium]|nr:winged helix-turn-helix domain-containing protein [Paludibacteraceae bacterium]